MNTVEPYKIADSLIVRFDDDSLPILKKEIAEQWAASLYQQAQEERNRHEIDKAILTIEKALLLDSQEAYQIFRSNLVPEHIAYLKENIQKSLDEKKYEKALSIAKRTSSSLNRLVLAKYQQHTLIPSIARVKLFHHQMRYAESSFQPLVAHILAFHVKNVNLRESVDFAIL